MTNAGSVPEAWPGTYTTNYSRCATRTNAANETGADSGSTK